MQRSSGIYTHTYVHIYIYVCGFEVRSYNREFVYIIVIEHYVFIHIGIC